MRMSHEYTPHRPHPTNTYSTCGMIIALIRMYGSYLAIVLVIELHVPLSLFYTDDTSSLTHILFYLPEHSHPKFILMF